MNHTRTYDYLRQSRAKVLDAVRMLSPEQYAKPFPFALKTVAATLTHLYTSEWYYIERVQGNAVPPYESWPIKEEAPPPFAHLEKVWSAQGERVRPIIASERDWSRRITWRSFPNEKGERFDITATAGDFLTQLTLHEVHHRAQVLVMLRELARPVEDIDFNAMMFERVPIA